MAFPKRCTALLLGIAVVVGPCVGCSHEHPAALDPYQGATDVSFREFGGADHVNYHVNAKFPAADVIGSISEKLAKEGWRASQHDELNPGGYSGDIAVWRQRILGSGQKERCAENWTRDWRNAPGDFLRYELVYDCPVPEVANEVPVCRCDPSILHDLEVEGVYERASVFQEGMRAIEEFEKTHPRR
jgi:hypothetical protein